MVAECTPLVFCQQRHVDADAGSPFRKRPEEALPAAAVEWLTQRAAMGADPQVIAQACNSSTGNTIADHPVLFVSRCLRFPGGRPHYHSPLGRYTTASDTRRITPHGVHAGSLFVAACGPGRERLEVTKLSNGRMHAAAGY